MNVLTRRLPKMKTTTANAGEERTESQIRSILLLIALAGAAPLFLFLYYQMTFAGLVQPDAMDYGQLGRNLSAGRGFCTEILRPLALSHGADSIRQPDVTHGPLYPFTLALAMGALGAKDGVVAGVSGLFFLLTVPLIYLLGARVFGKTVGIVAALGFACSSAVLQLAVSGLPVMLEVFLTTALLLALHTLATHQEGQPGAKPARGLLFLAGLLTGALYLADPLFVFILPVMIGAVFILCRRNRSASLGFFLLGMGMLTLPWMWRNFLLTSNPVFGLKGLELWMGTHRYPGYSAYRLVPGEMMPDFGLFQGVLHKILDSFVQSAPALVGSIGGPLLVFLIPSLLFRYQNTAANGLRGMMLLSALGLFLGQLLFGVNLTLFMALVPAMLIFSVAFMLHLGQQANLGRSAIVGWSALASVVVACLLVHDLWQTQKPQPIPQAALAGALKPRTLQSDVCLTDQPWLVAWYADRPALWLPADDAQTAVMQKRFNVRWLFLTGDAGALSPDWGSAYGLFARWNVAYQQAQALHRPTPPAFRIHGNGAPLLEALDGFGPVASEPVGSSVGMRALPPLAVMASSVPAVVPGAKQTAQAK